MPPPPQGRRALSEVQEEDPSPSDGGDSDHLSGSVSSFMANEKLLSVYSLNSDATGAPRLLPQPQRMSLRQKPISLSLGRDLANQSRACHTRFYTDGFYGAEWM